MLQRKQSRVLSYLLPKKNTEGIRYIVLISLNFLKNHIFNMNIFFISVWIKGRVWGQ